MNMNASIADYARGRILEGLLKLPEGHQKLFKRMYSHNDLASTIEDVVKNMEEGKLDWALTQVQNSLKKEKIDGKEERTT